MTGALELIWSMYGDPEVVGDITADGSVTSWEARAGMNGKLRTDHPYVSAVATLHTRTVEQDFASRWWGSLETEERAPEALPRLLTEYHATLAAADLADEGYAWLEVL